MWVRLAAFTAGTDKDLRSDVSRDSSPEEIQEHSWECLLVVALLRSRHISFERSGKLVRLLIGLLFTEGSEADSWHCTGQRRRR